MGKGTIISGGSGGLYQVQVNLDRTRIAAEQARLTTSLAAVTAQLADAPPGPARDQLRLTKLRLEQRQAWLERIEFADPTVAAWCVDLTEDLTGEVATIEINGEREAGLLIAPGAVDQAAYVPADHGQLQTVVAAAGPAGVFANLALMPGWQKWRPTYRVGEITVLAGDTCSVALDPATFSGRGSGLRGNLNINQNTEGGLVTLSGVPIHYMSCDGQAFTVGDRVVVHFIGQDWATPEVIGFAEQPKACITAIVKISLTLQRPSWSGGESYGQAWALFWDIANNRALPVPKTGGGYWSYPLTQADAEGDFLADLDVMFGSAAIISQPGELISKISTGLSSPLKPAGADYIAPRGWSDIISTPGQFLSGIDGDLDFYGNFEDSADNRSTTDAETNAYGTTDSVTINESRSVSGDASPAFVFESSHYYGGHGAATWQTRTQGPRQAAVAEIFSDQVATPSGGFCFPGPVTVSGFTSDLILPALGFDDCQLRCNNNSNAATRPYGVGVEWAGAGSRQSGYSYHSMIAKTGEIIDLDTGYGCLLAVRDGQYGPVVLDLNNCYPGDLEAQWLTTEVTYAVNITGTFTYSGDGVATLPNGTPYQISLAQTVELSIASGGALDVPNLPFDVSWSADLTRSADYLFRAVKVASDYSLVEEQNYQIVIVAESISAGHKTSLGGPADFPSCNVNYNLWTWDWPAAMDERDLAFSGGAVEYSLSAIAGLCDDADTQNPWELGNNADLTAALQAMTEVVLEFSPSPNQSYPANQVSDDLNFWALNFAINPVTFA